jgi:hypothetical protein
MEALYLYCVTPAGLQPPRGLRGLHGSAVTSVPAGDLALWASPIGPGSVDASIEAIQAHHQVVEAAITPAVTPVPLRFGQTLASAEAARDLLDRERELWLRQLDLFAGCMEFGVRVVDPRRTGDHAAVPSPPVAGGREYLEQVSRRYDQRSDAVRDAEEVAESARRILGGVVRDQRVEPLRTAHGVATIAHLVERRRFDEYHGGIAALRETLPVLRFLVSGPWPPYSFAT